MNPILLFVSLSACTSDKGVTVYNTDPSATITSHEEGAELLEGYDIIFRGSVSDANHQNANLLVTWLTDVRELCPAQNAVADGTTVCTAKMEEGETQVKLQVVDPEGAAYVETINVLVQLTQAPTAQIISPAASESYYSDQLILFSAIIDDAEDTPQDLRYEWSSSIDGSLPVDVVAETNGEIEQYTMLTEGQHALTLTVEDTSGKTTSETVAIAVGGPNHEPICSIIEPQPEAVYVIGQNISFSGLAADEDINNSTLSVQWESNIDGVFDSTPPITDGTLGFTTNGLSAGNHTITLRVEDEVEGLCTDAVQVAIGTAPILTLSSPLDGTVYSISDSISFQATVEDEQDIAQDITLSWSSDIDGEFSTQGANSNGNISFSMSTLTAGLHNISVTATDTMGLTDSASLSLRVNTPPTAPSVDIVPNPAATNDGLVATASGSIDEDGDNVSYAYSWTKNGNGTSYNGANVPALATSSGELWTVRVTPNDGYIDGAYTESSIVISNTEPTVTSVSIFPSSATNDDTLTCTATSDDADEVLVPTYTWMVDGTAYAGATIDLSSVGAMPNDVVTCTALVTDSGGAQATSSASLTISNRSPIVSSVSIGPTMVYSNTEVSCNAIVQDDDGESLTASYEWFVGSNSIGAGANLSLNAAMVAVGDALICRATVQDGFGGTDSADQSVVIQNTDPVIDSLELEPSEPNATDTLTCSAIGSDLDGDTPLLSFSWSNRTTGAVYTSTSTGAAFATLDLSATSVVSQEEIECLVVATDSDGGSVSDTISVVITNSGPQFDVAASIDISPDVYVGDVLTCSAAASDLDDGVIVPTYTWSVNGSIFASGMIYTVDSSHTDVGDDLVCTATATDSDGETATSTASVTVQNTAPTVSNVQISTSGSFFNDDVLTCSADVEDLDDNINSTTYVWSIGSVQIGTGMMIDLSTKSVMPDDIVTCTVQTTDDNAQVAQEDASVPIINRTPVVSGTSIDNTTPFADDTLTCSATASDSDGETVAVTYSWTNGSTVLGSNASLTLTPSTAGVGETITCTASTEDGYGGSDSGSATATVQNTAPTMSVVSVTPSAPSMGDTLVCAASGTDLNDGSLSAAYSWKNEATQAILGFTDTLTLSSSTSSAGNLISCTVTFTDNDGSSISDFAAVTITNNPPVFDVEASITPSPNVKTTETLTCSAQASDTEGAVTLSYSWTVGTNEIGTASTYTVSANDTDVGDTIDCTVTATDSDGETATSAASVTVINTPPVITDTDISPSPEYNDDTFTCPYTYTDVDGHSVTHTVEWGFGFGQPTTVTGEELDGTTTSLMPDDFFFCRVTIDDGHGGTDTDTKGAFVNNRRPSEPGVEITPSSPIEGVDDLVCNIVTPSVDLDGQTVTYEYEWRKNNVQTSYTSNTIPASATSGGDSWKCSVRPYDGTGYGFYEGRDTVTVIAACTGFLTDCDDTIDLGGGQGIDFVNITAGSFAMGSPTNEQGRYSNEDQHPVTLTNDFSVSTTEITQGMFFQLMGYNSYDGESTTDSNGSIGVGNDYPAYHVSWSMAADFSNQLTQWYNVQNNASLQECYTCSNSGTTSADCSTNIVPIYSCSGYRLLTEAEWEYAARAGSTNAVWTSNGGAELPSGYNGSTYVLSDGFDLRTYGWYLPTYNNPNGAKEVAGLLANSFGLHDMVGNVWEWTHDAYVELLGTGATTDPYYENDPERVFRGGRWNMGVRDVRSATRNSGASTVRDSYFGFRIGKTSP